MTKYIQLDNFEELLKLINERDRYMDWTDEFEKADNKVDNTIEWLRRNAKSVEEVKNSQ